MEAFVTEAELKTHLDTAEESPKQIAAAVLGLPETTLRYKPKPESIFTTNSREHQGTTCCHRANQVVSGRQHVYLRSR